MTDERRYNLFVKTILEKMSLDDFCTCLKNRAAFDDMYDWVDFEELAHHVVENYSQKSEQN